MGPKHTIVLPNIAESFIYFPATSVWLTKAMDEEQQDDNCFLEYQPEGQFVRGH